jgi:hypothetical protein
VLVKNKATLIFSAALACVAVAVPATHADRQAAASKSCSLVGYYRSLGASYVHRLTVRGISCASGRGLVRSYNACRRRNGGARGRCGSVRGYSCTEFRRSSRFQFDATASCNSGSRRFVVSYTQNV